MRTFGRLLGKALALLVLLVAGLWLLGPYEGVSLKPRFDPAAIGADVDGYFAAQEAKVDGITPGVEKRVVWAGEPGEETELAIVYVHGFSATSEEARPVPDRVAEAFGANLVFTRLAGHGLDGDALAAATVQDWADDVAEALEVARRVGDQVVIMAMSTGATLVTGMMDQPDVMDDVAGVILIAPNFGINNPLAPALTWPAARYWLPVLAGKHREWEPENEANARYWTYSYPATAVFQMAALVKEVAAKTYSRVTVPTLFWFTQTDTVVSPEATQAIISRWGPGAEVRVQEVTAGTAENGHNILGDILSPGATEGAVAEFIRFINGL